MIKTYPVVLSEGTDGYVVRIPDFGAYTEGKDISEAIFMARDAIGLIGIDYEDDGKELPIPSEVKSIKAEGDEIVTLVDVDFLEYRKMHESRAVRKNCSIPAWLAYKAEKAGLNYSAILQRGLKDALEIE